MRSLLLVITLIPFSAISADYPKDAEAVLEKLDRFEAEELEKAKQNIAKKRAEVAVFLREILERETKAGNLETALLLKKQIDEWESTGDVPEVAAAPPLGGGPTMNDDFEGWLKTVRFVDTDGQWEVTKTEVIQHRNKGAAKQFKREKGSRDREISFEAVGTKFRFELDGNGKKGFRTSEKFPPIPFTVKSGK